MIFSSVALAEEPAAFDLYMTNGTLALDQKEYTEAVENFRAALKKKPEDPSANLYLGIA